MTFQALLFCPDEKTARTATQVLNELEFSVEACNEPFAAVKKLMGKHFDAVVVDCENEQNASLLFKSARNSAANQGALAVAVVEGQTGVANAFRVGANLVLTKPINVEQAKSTLRVARGLLRKGTDAKTPAAPGPAAAATPVVKPAVSATKTPAMAASSPPKPAVPVPPKAKPAPPIVAATGNNVEPGDLFETDTAAPASPAGEESLLETAEKPTAQSPWKPVSKPAAAIAPSLQRALENVAKSSPAAQQPPKSPVPPPRVAPSAVPVRGQGGAASAPAPALEATRTVPALFAGQSASAKQSAETSAELFTGVAEPPEPLSAPSFAALDLEPEEGAGGGAKKGIIIAVAAVVLIAAAYFGYTKFAVSKTSQPVASVPSQNQAVSQAEEPAAGQEMDITVGGSAATNATSQQVIIERTPVRTAPTPKGASAAATTGSSKPGVDEEEEITTTHPDTSTLVVKSDLGSPKSAPKQPTTAENVAPPELDSLSGAEASALPSIVKSAPASVPRVAPPAGPVKVSQGVTQGLILKRVQPAYPQQALQMRVHGTVQLQAEISKTGAIGSIKVLNGDAVLARAAVQAVSQWKYKPYFLNGEPVDIQTQITVNFKLPNE